ncbi:MAG: ATPase [Methanoculleus thermophilus]|uniref:V/A-type H+-transporting ATPase subunit G/H n=3 Tax=Methanoculleus TaxID=45989 RepID=A0A1G9BET7_9EURY|nr:ATPase [Methanoculleus thermophilus]SDK38009.1 V/A-type H+-transporting ATPase subunit G/H [Methanoculleus thermophilus]HQD26876.1 V-type ATPase subunit subunit G family protein [Methanoculleus thermophilus]
MKTDVLKSIRETEEEYQAMIRDAQAERKKSLSDAELEADNLVQKAQKDATDYRNQRLAEARAQAQNRYKEIVNEGKVRAEALKAQGNQNLAKAVDFIVTRFKEQLHVKA